MGCRRDAAVSARTQLQKSQGIHVSPHPQPVPAAGGGSPLQCLAQPWHSDSEPQDAAEVAEGLPGTASAPPVCGHPAAVPSSLWSLLCSGGSSLVLGVRALLRPLLKHWAVSRGSAGTESLPAELALLCLSQDTRLGWGRPWASPKARWVTMESHRQHALGPGTGQGGQKQPWAPPNGAGTHLRHQLLTRQAGYKQPKPFTPNLQQMCHKSLQQCLRTGFTAPAYTGTPALSNSPAPPVPTIATAPSTWPSEKRKGRKQQQNSSFWLANAGLQS